MPPQPIINPFNAHTVGPPAEGVFVEKQSVLSGMSLHRFGIDNSQSNGTTGDGRVVGG